MVYSSKIEEKRNRNSEEAAKYLNYRWFFDCKPTRYIYWRIGDSERQADGSWLKQKDGWREAYVPEKPFGIVDQNLKGMARGVTWIEGQVPCVVTDLDNHDFQYSAAEQAGRFRTALTQLKRLLPSLTHVADINPLDGSLAVLSFDRKFRPMSPRLSDTIYEAVQPTLGQIEVFPYKAKPNDPRPDCRSRRLPLQPDRIMVVGSRILEKCNRNRRSQERGNYINEEYSPEAFINAVNNQDNADPQFVESILRNVITQRTAERAPESVDDVATPVGRDIMAAQDGNAYDRQYKALMPFSRQLGRVPSVNDALAFLKKTRCFSGSWNETLRVRTTRVHGILKRIAKTFDAAKCRGPKSKMPRLMELLAKCRAKAMLSKEYKIELFGKASVDEYGNVQTSKVRVRWVKPNHARCLAAILKLLVEDNEDGGIPRDSTEGYWNDFHAMGLLPKWDTDYYLACRDLVVKLWNATLDHRYGEGVAKTASFPEERTFDDHYEYPQQTYNPPHPLNCGDVNETIISGDGGDGTNPRPPPDG